MRKRIFSLFFAFVFLFSSIGICNVSEAASASLSVSSTSVAPLGTISVSFSNGSGISGAWIGMYKTGSTDQNWMTYQYIDTKTSGTLTFTAPGDPGTYEFRIFKDSGYVWLASSNTFTVGDTGGTSSPYMTLSSANVAPSEKLNVTYYGGSGISGAWIGMYKPGAADTSYMTYQYIDTKTSGTLTFTAPSEPGTYEFRMFKDNGYVKIATSSQLKVGDTTTYNASLTISSIYSGGVSVSYSGGSGLSGSWVGMFKEGAADSAYLAYQYINTSKNGTLDFATPTEPGTYEFRIFKDSGFVRLATSSKFTVSETNYSPYMTISSTNVTPGSNISVSYYGGSGLSGSWVGLFKAGAADSAYLAYQYINTSKSGTLNFTAPIESGTYEFRIFKDNGFVRLATSSQFTVAQGGITLNATSAKNGILLTWNASSDSSVVGYNLYRGNTSRGETSTPITDFYIKGTSHIDLNADPNVISYYILKPVYKNGTEGPASNEAYAYPGTSSSAGMTIVLKINDPYMSVNGISQEIDPGRGTAPMIISSRTLVPIRAIIEAMGGAIFWDEADRKITIQTANKTIELWVDKKDARVNGVNTTTDVPPQIINGRTMVPIRFVTENLNSGVEWDGEQKKITIKVNE